MHDILDVVDNGYMAFLEMLNHSLDVFYLIIFIYIVTGHISSIAWAIAILCFSLAFVRYRAAQGSKLRRAEMTATNDS